MTNLFIENQEKIRLILTFSVFREVQGKSYEEVLTLFPEKVFSIQRIRSKAF